MTAHPSEDVCLLRWVLLEQATSFSAITYSGIGGTLIVDSTFSLGSEVASPQAALKISETTITMINSNFISGSRMVLMNSSENTLWLHLDICQRMVSYGVHFR